MNVLIKEGTYNFYGKPRSVAGMVFPLVKGYRVLPSGEGYITVDANNSSGFPDRSIRIKVAGPTSYQVVDGDIEVDGGSDNMVYSAETQQLVEETDDEIKKRLRERFKVLSDMTQAAKQGDVRAIIVSGPPGVGKSFGVEAQLAKQDLFNDIAGRKSNYEVVKGAMSAIGLYCKLFEFSDAGNIIVFDDCDSVLFDELSLNILKAALDTSKKRNISWNTDSRVLRAEGIPSSFQFNASAIFITNVKFENVRSKRMKDHLEALESRCHYIDLTINTERDKMLRIKQIVEDGMLREYNFEPEVQVELLDYIDENKKKLRELSLRTVLKLADLRKSFGNRWQDIAAVTCMK
jgi:hypothetical protein